MTNFCPFCVSATVIASAPSALILHDAFPLAHGHTLVVPRRHVASLFELSAEVQAELWQLVAQVRSALVEQLHPDGFTIGVNDGEAAGQTVPHAHIHVIPRYVDDVPDPRGGIRWVLPEKAAYWKASA